MLTAICLILFRSLLRVEIRLNSSDLRKFSLLIFLKKKKIPPARGGGLVNKVFVAQVQGCPRMTVKIPIDLDIEVHVRHLFPKGDQRRRQQNP